MRRIALVAAVLLGLLLVAQVALPAVAERNVRDELRGGGGDVASVDVSAFPAIKLLWSHADRVRLRVRSARLGAGDLAEQLQRTDGVGRLDAVVEELALGPLRLRDLSLRKRGDRLSGAASLTRADLLAAIPVDVGLRPVEAGDGDLVLEAQVGPVTARARLSASDGALRIAPDGLLGGFAALTVFEDPRVYVTGVGARPRADGFTLTAEGRLGAA